MNNSGEGDYKAIEVLEPNVVSLCTKNTGNTEKVRNKNKILRVKNKIM